MELNPKQKKRKTIAFLIRGLTTSVGIKIWEGICDEAARRNVNLITLLGNKLDGDPANSIYDLVRKNTVDGIIAWASSDLDKFADYYDNYAGIPLVTLTLKIKNYPVIAIDTYSGMRDAVEHLITVHKFTKIGFIRGPEHHAYAIERYKAYLDAIAAHGIPKDNQLITPCVGFTHEDGIAGFNILCKERNLQHGKDIEAIVTISDNVAFGVLDACKLSHISVPDELAVTGYNFSEQGICSTPSVTSVAMPFELQGEKAVDILIDLMDGKNTPDATPLKSRFEIQQSCGCGMLKTLQSQTYHEESEEFEIADDPLRLKRQHIKNISELFKEPFNEIIIQELAGHLITNIGNIDNKEIISMAFSAKFIEAFQKDVFEQKEGHFISELESILSLVVRSDGDTKAWQGCISILRNHLRKYELFSTEYLKGLHQLDQARIIISEYTRRQFMSRSVVVESRMSFIRELSTNMISTTALDKLKTNLSRRISDFSIDNYFLVLYDKIHTYKFPDPLPQTSTLLIAHDQDHDLLQESTEQETFFTHNLLPDSMLTLMDKFNFLILPLYVNDSIIGHLILNNARIESNIYPLYRDILSSALHNIFLINELSKTRDSLEETLQVLKSKASTISKNSVTISDRVNDISAASEQSARSIDTISGNINDILEIVHQAVKLGTRANSLIAQLRDHSDKIGGFSKVIYDIAEQTNVLSINAAIEAARAGDTGRGFSIVAREIKDLSKKTVQSTEDINGIIKIIQESTQTTSENVGKVISIIENISTLSENVTTAIEEQSKTTNNIASLLTEAAAGTKEIAEEISEVASGE
ncbi:MAG: substrate-binding domain-containing protein [Spirochaetales bacterium]|nr:substrate-binding domain-containing protein [Spirochaetales bacterium]